MGAISVVAMAMAGGKGKDDLRLMPSRERAGRAGHAPEEFGNKETTERSYYKYIGISRSKRFKQINSDYC